MRNSTTREIIKKQLKFNNPRMEATIFLFRDVWRVNRNV